MNPERFQRAKEILLGALELPVAERASWLDATCGADVELRAEVESLLDEEATESRLLDEGVLGPHTSGHLLGALHAIAAQDAMPERVGPYEILGVLGEGGMGMVYHGRQHEPLTRDVAVKVLRPGLDGARVMARFEWERRALARLEHPNVARVLDAGTDPTSRRPYVVMPLIPGAPITRYCEEAGLPLRTRLELFLKVCRAVEHAHARGVLHRDLKPGNVLVHEIDGEAVPTVIDFGIAKALDPETSIGEIVMTVEGQRVGTPAYMSPEQLRHDAAGVDVRSDVYALGVILWELLTGSHPFGDRVDSITRALELGKIPPALPPPSRSSTKTDATTTASRWRRQLRGDLDTICETAIHFERARRYASAAHLADDVQRFLEGHPLLARPVGTLYRLGKSMRRHPVLTTSIAGAVAVLLTGTALLAINAQRLGTERDRARAAEQLARQEAASASAIATFLEKLFTDVDPTAGNAADLSARELLQQGSDRARRSLGDHPELRAPLLSTLARVQHALGLDAPAESLLVAAIADFEAMGTLDAKQDSLFAESLHMLAVVRHDLIDYENAEHSARAALGAFEHALGPRSERAAVVLADLALIVQAQGRFDEAAELLNRSLDLLLALVGPDDPEVSWTRSSLGYVHARLGQLEAARAQFEEALAIQRRLDPADVSPPDLAYALNNLGGLYIQIAQADRALPLLEEALALCVATYTEEHPLVSRAHSLVSSALRELGRYEEAHAHVDRAHEISVSILGNEHLQSTRVLKSKLLILHAEGRYAEALEIARSIRGTRDRLLGPDNPHTVDATAWIARNALELGDATTALREVDIALAGYTSLYEPDHPDRIEARWTRARALSALDREDEARSQFEDVLDDAVAKFGPTHPTTEAIRRFAEQLDGGS